MSVSIIGLEQKRL